MEGLEREEPFVVHFRRPPWWAYVALGALPVGAVAALVFDRSLESVLLDAFLLVCCVWIVAVSVASRRAAGGRPREIVATREGIRTHVWSLRWDRVARVAIAQRRGGRTLVIEPHRRDDVQHAPSRILRWNARITELMRQPQIAMPERVVDRPLEEILEAFEAKARRPLA